MSRHSVPHAPASPRLLPVLLALVLALGFLVGMPVSAAADGPKTFDNMDGVITIPAAGSTAEPGPANPYPSRINVSDMTGTVTKVTVTFHGVDHQAATDIDALIVGPNGANLLIMSDVGPPDTANNAANIELTFDDDADAELDQVVAGEVQGGSYQPTNNSGGDDGGDAFPSPAPTPSPNSTLGQAFTGMPSANGTWLLYVVDDEESGDIGTMSGWSLTITTEVAAVATAMALSSSDTSSLANEPVTFTATVIEADGGSPVGGGSVQFADGGTNLGSPVNVNGMGIAAYTAAPGSLAEGDHVITATYIPASGFAPSSRTLNLRVDNATVISGSTFCNPGRISTPSAGQASPYPSRIFVSGMAGEITKLTASLRGVTHDSSIDLDVLLASPTTTRNVLLLSDVGGFSADPATNADLVFDDDADDFVPTSIVSGTYKPTNLDDESSDTMSGAPTPSGATLLSTFDRTSPNGTWTLWVVDDAPGTSGSIADGWCLTIEAQVETTTELSAVPSSSIFGQSVTFTASVTGAGNPVTAGSVEFKDGAIVLGTVPLAADGTADFRTHELTVDTHTITATYLGTDSYAESENDLSYVVSLRPTVTTVTSSANPSDVGEPVTFTATVTDAGSPVTTGTVQFSIDGTEVGDERMPNASGQVTYLAQDLDAGTHTVVAAYSGTPDTVAASIGNLDPDQAVQRLQPTGTLIAVPDSSQVNQSVTFTATFAVDDSPATPGDVDFTDDGAAIATCTDVPVDGNGVATCATTFMTADRHPIVATFAQTGTYAEATATLDYVVGLIPTSTALGPRGTPSEVGQQVTFTATVTAVGAPVPNGSVRFSDDGADLCANAAVNSGVATCVVTFTEAGEHPITATYQANATYDESVSDVVRQVVELVDSTTTVATAPNPSNPGDTVTVTATVVSAGSGSDPTPDGTVAFTIDGSPAGTDDLDSGVATISVSGLAPGTHTIVATYSGDTTYATSTDTAGHGVQPIADAGGPYAVAEGGTLRLQAGAETTGGVTYGWDLNGDDVFTDAVGADPTLTWDQLQALDIDDGLDPAVPVTIRLRVSLDDVLSDPDDAFLSVTNTAPTSVLTGGLTATVGVPFTIKVGASDPSAADMAAQFVYTVDWGDGSPVVSVPGPADPPVTHVYVAAGNYNATFTATDKDGGTGPGTRVVVTAEQAQVATPTPTPSPTDDDGDDNAADGSDDTSSSSGSLASTGSAVGVGTFVASLLLLGGGVGLLIAGKRRSGRREG